ncbi:hypothetical protein E4U19_000228 [Claviceps sp. Clav32 group G5]|nr:hypothetical protein E4U19_000228 [Claviceps sp. Clav32 group G5]
MTIHKSQGMIRDLAIVDLKAIFADIALDDIRPNVTRALELRRLDEARRAPQITNAGSINAPSSYVLYGGVYG